jgi:signal transduction histidine kinase
MPYTLISMGIIGSIFIYESMKNESKIKIVEKTNYNLREKIFNLEENKSLENKANYQNIEAVKIEERNIISQKLHDKIGHVLAGSIMQLEALKIIIDKDRDKGMIMLDGITNNLRYGMDDIRTTLRKIKPENNEIGVNNLKLILEEFSKEYKIENRITFEGDINEINFVYWKVILDCVKESLTNIIKHSNADLLNVDISVLNQIIRIHIKDNGSKAKDIKKGMGLLGIEERVVNINGNVYFNNEDGFSTLIILKR